jgi:hypothetical protein
VTEPTAGAPFANDEAPAAEPAPPAGTAEAGLGTGDPRVDEALARLRELDSLPTAEQVPVLEDIHQRLQDALADLEGG